MHTWAPIHLPTYTRTHGYTYLVYPHINIPIYLPIYLPNLSHTHTYIHIYIHTYIQTYRHTNVLTYLPTYINSYIPTYIHCNPRAGVSSAFNLSNLKGTVCMWEEAPSRIEKINVCHGRVYVRSTYIHTYLPTYLHTYRA